MNPASAKAPICWAAFLLIWLGEIWIHVKCGFDAELFEAEAECIHAPSWGYLLAFSEGVCRSGMVVVLIGTVWECVALLHSGECIEHVRELLGETGKLALPAAMGLSSFVVGLGLWSIFDEESMPFWSLLVCHVCDMGCHSIIAAALVGLIFDFSVAITEGRAGHFIRHFIRCTDSIESHGVTEEASGDEDHNEAHMSLLKVAFLWLAFLVAVLSYSLQYWGHWVPNVLAVTLDVAGVTCWGGIMWWVVGSLSGPLKAVAHLMSGKSLANLGLSRRYSSRRRQESSTTSDEEDSDEESQD